MSTEDARALFVSRFGREPAVIASAPGRVNLIGEHVDYNGGEVLPAAIGLRTFVALDRAVGRSSRAVSAAESEGATFSITEPRPQAGWIDYVAGAIASLPASTEPPVALDLAIWSEVPRAAGLSSSAALGVAVATGVAALSGASLSGREIALAAHLSETTFVGVPCGIMDQFASALGSRRHAVHIWCDTGEHDCVPMNDAVLIFDTGVSRELRGSAYNARVAECREALRLLREIDPTVADLSHASPELVARMALPAPLDRRAAHVVSETMRVREIASTLREQGSLSGELLLASHRSLADNYECSSRELDWFVDHAMSEPGIVGARLSGAGWGGCAIAVGSTESLEAAAPRIAAGYRERFAREPRTWISHAEDGARVDDIR